MIRVFKGTEPARLANLRNRCAVRHLSPVDSYKKLKGDLKQEVRESLTNEQGHLCVYCMTPISSNETDMSIEHYFPKSPDGHIDRGQGLDYQNLFAVCRGNELCSATHVFNKLTCDKHKKNTILKKVNPLDESTLKTIYYTHSGEIHAKDPNVEFDLNETLNLNSTFSPLNANRKAALDALVMRLSSISDECLLPYCSILLHDFENERDPKTRYVGVLIWYLKHLLNEC